MEIVKVKNVVIGVCSEAGNITIKLRVSGTYMSYVTKTRNLNYHNGTPINYPKIFSGLFQ